MQTVLPLYHFFNSLRENDFALGIGEYEKLLKALDCACGLGINNYNALLKAIQQRNSSTAADAFPKESVLRLAKLLWLKPGQSEQLFEDLFEDNYLRDELQVQDRTNNSPGDQIEKREPSSPYEKKSEYINAYTGQEEKTEGAGNRNEFGDTEELLAGEESVKVRIALSEHKAENELNFDQRKKPEIERSKFLFTRDHFPIDKRKVQQNFKGLPVFRFTNSSHEPDIELTIEKALNKGFFNEVVFRKLQSNASNLTLLIDHGGSMTAFEQLADLIRKEIKNVLPSVYRRNENSLQTFYFDNAPLENFYLDSVKTRSINLDKVLDSLKNRSAGILIISDAGAARNNFNLDRVNTTVEFLKKLHSSTNKIAWLNPIPRHRWQQSSAGDISKFVAMFEITEKGLKNAVDFLKGSSSKAIRMTDGIRAV